MGDGDGVQCEESLVPLIEAYYFDSERDTAKTETYWSEPSNPYRTSIPCDESLMCNG
jgi:hypothetical protein